MPLTCPYNNCEKTFSGRASLREHKRSHKGQTYWETLNRISGDSHENLNNEVEGTVHIFYYISLNQVMLHMLHSG